MKKINITVAPEYSVIIESGAIGKINEYIGSIGNYNRIAILTDKNVAELYLNKLIKYISKQYIVSTFVFEVGETSKSIENLSRIYDFLAENEITRTDLIIALGGGVVGDVVGYAASSYLRGVDFINIPTTLLAMVDSSVGGKTGINIKYGKNQVGAFYQPKIVLCDTDTLSTLSDDIIKDGIGEITKYAVLENKGIFEILTEGKLSDNYIDLIAKCVEIKNEYVTADVYDKGKRQLLNLGHTLGHVIEKDSNYTVSHGKAVFMGLYMLTELFAYNEKIKDILNKLECVAGKYDMQYVYNKSAKDLWKMAVNDKKRSGDTILIARPYAISDCRLEKVNINMPLNFTEETKKSKFDIVISPVNLKGTITAPPSKSMAHRLLIACAFSGGKKVIDNISFSDDILATMGALKALGVKVDRKDNSVSVERGVIPERAIIDCGESGTTLRFMIPICAMLGVNATFVGKGRLGERTYSEIADMLKNSGVRFDRTQGLPLEIKGTVDCDNFNIVGNVSSQFISGLMLAAYVATKNISVNITTNIESESYIDMTIDILMKFGVDIIKTDGKYYLNHSSRNIKTDDKYIVESDYSNGAFFSVAGVNVLYNNPYSCQGDKAIIDIINESKTKDILDIDIGNIPDLAPIIGVLFTKLNNYGIMRNCSRLRIKESDRLSAIFNNMTKIGIKCEMGEDWIKIYGGNIKGGVTVNGYNDHRIVMSMAIASTISESPIIITDANAVAKSYPDFWEDYVKCGGNINVINIR